MTSVSDDADVLRFLALLAGSDVELDLLALVKRLVAAALDVGVMDEYVVAFGAGDEAEALFRVEEFHSACCHDALCLGWFEPVEMRSASRRYKVVGNADGLRSASHW